MSCSVLILMFRMQSMSWQVSRRCYVMHQYLLRRPTSSKYTILPSIQHDLTFPTSSPPPSVGPFSNRPHFDFISSTPPQKSNTRFVVFSFLSHFSLSQKSPLSPNPHITHTNQKKHNKSNGYRYQTQTREIHA